MTDLTLPRYHDENAAREHLEGLLWANGRACPHCGVFDQSTALKGESTRPGVYQCNACRKPFSVTVGTVFERSHVPLHKWLLATHLINSSKKGISSNQLSRMLGVTYKTAWFMSHRIREAMTEAAPGPLGGQDKVIEADETYIGGKEKNKHANKRSPGSQGGANKLAVVSLVERGGKVRSFHVANVTSENLRTVMVNAASRKSRLMIDQATVYRGVGPEFKSHQTVNHSIGEYTRFRGFVHTNTVEGSFATLKRGVYGVYHHVSEAHLHRYLAEFDFRYNPRSALGVNDDRRAAEALRGIVGKRLTYRRTGEAAHA